MKRFTSILSGDRAIWFIVLLLSIASLLLVYSAIVTLAYKHHGGNAMYYLFRHGGFLALGMGIIFAIHKINFTYFSRIAQLLFYAAIPLLLLTLAMGENINDASRWLRIPVINQSFQTSDFAKLALMMYLARTLAQSNIDKDSFKTFLWKICLPVFLVCGLILPANFSTAAVLGISSFVLMFIARVHLKFILGGAGIAVAAFALLLVCAMAFPGLLPRADTWKHRLDNWQSETQLSSDDSYQVVQSKIAIATGGIIGKGPGHSTQRNFLPHPYSDFIYAIVVEEYGIAGGFVILLLYIILLFRSVRIVLKCPKNFGAYLVIGITFLLLFQALINMGVAVNILPVTGQPLPLVSMGGTSIWFTCMALGVILSVSAGSDKEGDNKIKHEYQ